MPAKPSPKPRSYPFPAYPNSWYATAWSHEIGRKASKAVHFFGRDLVLFRGEDGKVNAIDAICPHLGAHLGAGGKVVGNTMECPFHRWRFDGKGTCVAIPYAERIPSKARVKSWNVREQNGQILVWFHSEGEGPTFEVPHMEGFGDPGWTKPTFHTLTVRTHVQEMNENVFDLAHFVSVHHFSTLPTADIRFEGPHVKMSLDGIAALPGRPLAPTHVENVMHGAGFTTIRVRSRVHFGPVGLPLEAMIVIGKTPIDEQHVEHRYSIVFRRTNVLLDRILHPMMRRQTIADIHQDSKIWENKQYLPKPVLVKPEGPIAQFRQWHRQFYSGPSSSAEAPPLPESHQ
jgi:phenylpropionate dioxygenase-like ring-hydroxylating dioxygenase large terminal subunit